MEDFSGNWTDLIVKTLIPVCILSFAVWMSQEDPLVLKLLNFQIFEIKIKNFLSPMRRMNIKIDICW